MKTLLTGGVGSVGPLLLGWSRTVPERTVPGSNTRAARNILPSLNSSQLPWRAAGSLAFIPEA